MNHVEACPACGEFAKEKPRALVTRTVTLGTLSLCCELVRCPSCGHGYLSPQPTASELDVFYSDGYHVFTASALDESAVKSMARDRWDETRSQCNHAPFAKGGRYLDVGCGLGDMVAAMSHLGMEAIGLDPSPVAVEAARKRGLDVRCGFLETSEFEPESFDSITLYHALEHTPEPVNTLRRAGELLKADGQLMIAVPNIEAMGFERFGEQWSHLSLPFHLQHFSRSSLSAAAERAGLARIDMKTESLDHSVEREFVSWARRRFLLPARVSVKTRMFKAVARRFAERAQKANRGDAIVAHFRPGPATVSATVGATSERIKYVEQ